MIDIFRVGKSARTLNARRIRIVHSRYIIRLHKIIRIELDKHLVIIRMLRHDLLKQKFKRISSLVMLGIGIEPLVHGRACGARYLGSIIGTIIRDNVYIEKLARIFLRKQTFDRIAYHRRLVSRGNNDRKSMFLFGYFILFGLDEKKQDINYLYCKSHSDYIEDNIVISKIYPFIDLLPDFHYARPFSVCRIYLQFKYTPLTALCQAPTAE